MGKYVVFSFDDGRLDTYTNAFPILKKYGYKATVNVVSDFVLHPENYTCFGSAQNKAMSASNLLELQEYGMEIALHGATHQNTVNDIIRNISELQEMGIHTDRFGFASPHSELTEDNCDEIYRLVEDQTISYIRTGIQTRREGLWYSALTLLERRTQSKKLFWYLNKNHCMKVGNFPRLLKSVSVTKQTSVKELKFLLEKLKDGEAVIFTLHSICPLSDLPKNRDSWYWTSEKLSSLCNFLSNSTEYTVVTTKDILNICI